MIYEQILTHHTYNLPSLKLTIFAPKNGWLEYFFVSFWGPGYFQVPCQFQGVNQPPNSIIKGQLKCEKKCCPTPEDGTYVPEK